MKPLPYKSPEMTSRLMKYLLLAFVSLAACKKNETLPTIEEYLASNNLTNSVVKDPRGFYYKIQEPGSGTTPTLTSRVKTLYKGMLTNGTVFDQSLVNPIEFTLNGVIAGWQYGIPLIKPGGKIILIYHLLWVTDHMAPVQYPPMQA